MNLDGSFLVKTPKEMTICGWSSSDLVDCYDMSLAVCDSQHCVICKGAWPP